MTANGTDLEAANASGGEPRARMQSAMSQTRAVDFAHLAKSKSSDTDDGASFKTDDSVPSLDWKERVRHFTWSWFTMTMATGSIANVLWKVPLRFHGLYAIGVIFFLLHVVTFIAVAVLMVLRFYWWPATLRASFMHPTESLFVPASVISLAIILSNITEYGLAPGKTGEWLVTTMVVMYWLYVGLAVAFSAGIYLLMWSTQVFTVSQMTPAWIFPAYPLLLVGPLAGALSKPSTGVTDYHALQIIVGGVIVQGLGFCVSFMIYSAYIYRLMTQKLPAEPSRPAMFISVGPSGFTISGLIHMGENLPHVLPPTFMHTDGVLAGQVIRLIAYWAGIWLWGLAIWFFFVSVGAHWSTLRHGRMDFSLTWYAFIFPNSALVTATFAVGGALDDNQPIRVLGCVMACLVIATWAFIVGMNARAVAVKQILWPQKGEDKDEDTWRSELKRRQRRDMGLAEGMRRNSRSRSGGGGGDTKRWTRGRPLAEDEERNADDSETDF